MRKICLGLMMALLLSIISLSSVLVYAEDDSVGMEIKLTEQQKAELSALHKEIFEKKKEVTQKYVEYGILTKEKADKIISRMERHYAEREQNGYMPKFEHHKKKH